MAKVQSRERLGKAAVKHAKKSKSQSRPYPKQHYCVLCRKSYFNDEGQEHMHSMLHHRELESALGKDSSHDCQACKASSMNLNEYALHISTAQHKDNLKRLISSNVKHLPLANTLSEESWRRILERNKEKRKEERKIMNKKKKKMKQVAAKQQLDSAAKVMSKVKREKEENKADVKAQKQMQQTHQKGNVYAVVQNKENKVSGLQIQIHQSESTLHGHNRRSVCLPGESTNKTVHHPYPEDHPRNDDDKKIKTEKKKTQTSPKKPSWTDLNRDYYNGQYDKEFTSDHLPQSGAIIFDHDEDESTREPQPGPELAACSANANTSGTAAPLRDVDVSSMLRQIRRALGVREPCRADREARKKQAGTGKAKPAGGSLKKAALDVTSASVQSPQVNDDGSAKQVSSEATQGPTQPWERSCDSNGPSIRSEFTQPWGESAVSALDRLVLPNMNVTSRVRIARLSGKVQREIQDGLKPLKWRPEKRKRKPRFGIELVNPFSGQEGPGLAEDSDLPLSEGFHWESFPATAPPNPQLPPPQNPTNDSRTKTRSSSWMQAAVGQPGPSQEYNSQTVAAVSVKVEPNMEEEDRDFRANKRKHKSNEDPQPGRKKKTKTNKDQGPMDQLLAVSLREEELSHSLHDVDKSLIEARSALQAAYTQVQQLLLLRQQFTAEVNSLRSQRIEILQGMQEGYCGTSNVVEKATTSSSGAGDAARPSSIPPSSVFATASGQLPPSTNPTSSISQPLPTPLAPPAVSIKPAPSVPLFPPDLILLSSPHLATSVTAGVSSKQAKAGCSTLASTPPSAESSCKQEEQVLQESVKRKSSTCQEAPLAESDSVAETEGNISNEQVKEKELPAEKSDCVPEKAKNASAAAPQDVDDDGGNESDASVEMIKFSDPVIINIDESDNENSPKKNVPVQLEPAQNSVSVELSSSSTQTSQQSVESKFQPVQETSTPPESVQLDEEPSVGEFVKHEGPVHGLQVHEGLLYTCSGDNTARAYSLVTRECQAVFEGHKNKVNCLLVSSPPNMPARLYTGSSDQTICCYSIKSKKCLEQISLPDRVLCLRIAWNILYAGLANGSVASHDLKTLKQLDVLECHGPRGVSCLGTAQEGARRVLLVGSYDSTISVRDAKSGLLLRTLEGHTKTVLCMKVVNDLVFSGSSDTSVHAHNIHTGELVRIYKGHGHAVTSIVILGKVMVTACLDKLIRVFELQSHDRLQVYGGHSDMVMCMAVHKSVIYTGCYDGSVQAVKLNLMKNLRCWWQNCSLIFGMAEHLKQHLVGDHTNPNLQTVKCRWKGCDSFFATQQEVRQELPKHMQSHIDKDSKMEP